MDKREKTALALLGLGGVAYAAWLINEQAEEKKRQETFLAPDPPPGEGPVPAADAGLDPLEMLEEVVIEQPEPSPQEFYEPPPRVLVGTQYLSLADLTQILQSRGVKTLSYKIFPEQYVTYPIDFGAVEVTLVPEHVQGMHAALHYSAQPYDNKFLFWHDGAFWMTSTTHFKYLDSILEAITSL